MGDVEKPGSEGRLPVESVDVTATDKTLIDCKGERKWEDLPEECGNVDQTIVECNSENNAPCLPHLLCVKSGDIISATPTCCNVETNVTCETATGNTVEVITHLTTNSNTNNKITDKNTVSETVSENKENLTTTESTGTSSLSLLEACKQGNLYAVESILNCSTVDVNQADADGWSALHEACVHSCQFIMIAQLLLQHGADPNIQDNNGETPLHGAVLFHLADTVKVLHENKADFNVCNTEGVSPLHIANFICDNEILKMFGCDLISEDKIPTKHKRSVCRKSIRKKTTQNITNYTPSPLQSPSILKKRKRIDHEDVEGEPTAKKSISFSL